MNTYVENINQLTRQYNDAIRALEESFEMEESQLGFVERLTSNSLKREYSGRYDALASEYRSKCRQMFNDYKLSHPEWTRWRKIWGRVFVAGILLAMVYCSASLISYESTPVSSFYEEATTETYWNADNIPIPYLQDATQYVSNPDSVLSQSAVNRMNVTLHSIEKELNIQSIVVVVNHIENDDPFRFAQDLGNKYGVGYDDRGLVVVVGYLDHSINMSPGRSLEADLTDAECHRLEQQYVVPAMRAEMPDSGMIYLVEAVYSTLKKKELPQMSALTSVEDEKDEQLAIAVGLTMLFYFAWAIFFLRLNRKYHWVGLLSSVPLLSNPFIVNEGVHFTGGGGFGGGGGFSGGGGFGGGGGSFGGGSFGGGGATSRW